MAAIEISTNVYILPNPNTSNHIKEAIIPPHELTFTFEVKSNIRTLYAGSTECGDNVSGILYVPQLPFDHPCASNGYIPHNATKLSLPDLKLDLIGYVPWISKECSMAYLNAASTDHEKTSAVVFYIVTNGGSKTMPSAHDPTFHIPFQSYHFPVYAISGRDGELLMNKLAEYSGNITEVWESPKLATLYDVSDYPRIYMKIDTGKRTPLPGLWLFLLIVFGLLLFIILLTSLLMHWIQYRRRADLRRRVASGEVDLEAMGIRRLNVPREVLDKFALRTYYANPPTAAQSSAQPNPITESTASCSGGLTPYPATQNGANTHPAQHCIALTPEMPLASANMSNEDNSQRHSNAYSQPTCAVCLDDFESGTSIVRELPCRHIFHPECIDPHLLANSSLCPLCKASTLPKGYVPPRITDATVRRERYMRRMLEQPGSGGGQSNYHNNYQIPRFSTVLSRWHTQFRDLRATAFAARASHTPANIEVRRSALASNRGRRNFSAAAALTEEEEDQQWRQLSRWRRLLRRLFPR